MIQARSITQAIGDWLFLRHPVYLISEPDRMLRQKKINWGRETCDLEDEQGRVYYEVPWDCIEFAGDVEFNLP
jgi:hypothetical protein